MEGITPNTQQHWTLFLLAAWEQDDDEADYSPKASELWEYDQQDNLFSDEGDTVFKNSESVSTVLSNLHSDGYVDRVDASDRSKTHTAYAYSLSDKGSDILQNELKRPSEKPIRRNQIAKTAVVAATESVNVTTEKNGSAPADTVDVDVDEFFDEDTQQIETEEDTSDEVVEFNGVIPESVKKEVKQNTLRHWTLYLIDALDDVTPNKGMTRFDLFNVQNPNADIYKASDSMSPTISTLIELGLLEEVDTRNRYTAYTSTEMGSAMIEDIGAPTQKQNRYTVDGFTRTLPSDKDAVEFYVEGDGSEISEPVTYRTLDLSGDDENDDEEDTDEEDTDEDMETQIVDDDGFNVDVALTSEVLIQALENVDEDTVASILGSEMTEKQASKAITTVIEAVAEKEE